MKNPGQMAFDFSDLEEEERPLVAEAIDSDPLRQQFVVHIPREMLLHKRPWQSFTIEPGPTGPIVEKVNVH